MQNHLQQQSPQTPSMPPTNITTEQIQKILDENQKLILAVLESHNLGKVEESAQYEDRLRKNLMYLAACADNQPQTPTVPSQPQVATQVQPTVSQGPFMQHSQSSALPFNLHVADHHRQPPPHQLQSMPGYMGMTMGGGFHPAIQTGPGSTTRPMDAPRSREEGSDIGSGDRQGTPSMLAWCNRDS